MFSSNASNHRGPTLCPRTVHRPRGAGLAGGDDSRDGGARHVQRGPGAHIPPATFPRRQGMNAAPVGRMETRATIEEVVFRLKWFLNDGAP